MSKLQGIIERLVDCTSHLDFYDLEKAKVCVRDAYKLGVEDGYASAALPLSNDEPNVPQSLRDILVDFSNYADGLELHERSAIKGFIVSAYNSGMEQNAEVKSKPSYLQEIIDELDNYGDLDDIRNLIAKAYYLGVEHPINHARNMDAKQRGMTMQEALLLAKEHGTEVRATWYGKSTRVLYDGEKFIMQNVYGVVGDFSPSRPDLTSEWEVYTPPSEQDEPTEEPHDSDCDCGECRNDRDVVGYFHNKQSLDATVNAPKTTGLTFAEAMQAVERGEDVRHDDMNTVSCVTRMVGQTYARYATNDKMSSQPYTPTFPEIQRTDWYIIPKEPPVTYVSFEEAIAAVKYQGKRARFDEWSQGVYIKMDHGEIPMFSLMSGEYRQGMFSSTPKNIVTDKWIILD